MRKFLEDLIARNKAKLEELKKRMNESQDADEVRSLGDNLIALRDEITDAETQLAELDNNDDSNDDQGNPAEDEGASRSKKMPKGGINPMATFGQGGKPEARADENPRASMEYRKAFMEYVQRGEVKKDVLQFRASKGNEVIQLRSDDMNIAKDLGVLLPETVVQEIIKGVEKVYGQLYAKVKKTNVKGGVKYPIGAFSATFHRIYETKGTAGTNPVAPSERQNAGAVTGYIEFGYKIGEIRLSRSLLESVLTVPVFEQELANALVQAYVQAMDYEILNGDGDTEQMCGILTEAGKIGQEGARLTSANVITFTAEQMADWKEWQKRLFAKIPLSMRQLRPEFVMTAVTYEANIKTLHDEQNRPVYAETFNPVDGDEVARFKGREVTFIEEGLGIENFDDAKTSQHGDYFGLYWVPEKAYAINSNLEFAVRRYFDEERNEYVDKALVINDGKILDPKYLFLLKKV